MIRLSASVVFLFWIIALTAQGSTTDDHQPRFRVAVIGFAQGESLHALTGGLARDGRVTLVDQAMSGPAIAALGYDGSLNLTTDEARRIGAAIGCDFFITGKSEVLTRTLRKNESHEEALIAVMIVDGRNGKLAAFDFINQKAKTKEEATRQAIEILTSRAGNYVDRMTEFRLTQEALPEASNDERIEEMPDEDSPRSTGFTPPEFSNRVKPEYTDEAGQANVSATVEALAVFRYDGRVGKIEITRWAGFGLDEAAARAIRSLEFKPATREGQAVSVRALIRYNFRRVDDAGENKEEPAPTRDLRPYFKRKYPPV